MKNRIISFLIVAIVALGLFVFTFAKDNYSSAKRVYQVYLNGTKIGLLNDDDDLYDLINEKQQEIKEKYNVKKVYPPNSFDIIETYTYDDKVNDVDEIYKQIEEADDFTIKGYVLRIHKTEKDEETGEIPEDIVISTINKDIIDEALHNFVYSFVGEENYKNYINGTQPEIKDVGKKIQNLYFNDQITIKEAKISVNDKIFTDATSLSQYLLFGEDITEQEYTVKQGDTIQSVSENNKLNPQEFLIANPRYRSEDSLLTINDKVSIALIKPVLSLTAEMYAVEDVEQYYEKQVVYDDNKPMSYSKVTQEGQNGITRITQTYKEVNGDANPGEVINKEVIKEKVNQVTTKGKKPEVIYGNFVDTGGDWAWPTNGGYKITSKYEWRWGKFHEALDIAFLPKNSPVYAAGDGVVVTAKMGTGSAWSLGNYVIIRHPNGIYTLYAHMNTLSVSAGQEVKKGRVLGGIGRTGRATGDHLHFAAYNGMPYQGGQHFNPMLLYK